MKNVRGKCHFFFLFSLSQPCAKGKPSRKAAMVWRWTRHLKPWQNAFLEKPGNRVKGMLQDIRNYTYSYIVNYSSIKLGRQSIFCLLLLYCLKPGLQVIVSKHQQLKLQAKFQLSSQLPKEMEPRELGSMGNSQGGNSWRTVSTDFVYEHIQVPVSGLNCT